ncbi:MAG: lipid-A-disaccharide synthase [Marinosulfonomonas sp.]|nr:lipid-A-disaccharide synthase [Marinosulfonomonas sp.]
MRVFLIAGEASGDKLGAALMAGLKQLVPGVEFVGVGGGAMQAAGMSSLFAMDELSVMGLVEILPKYRQLKRRIAQTSDAILAQKPDVLITIDSPDFCLRVAALVKAKSNIRIVHYVAPSVWAWRPGRAAKMARHVDQVLALLPFEPPLMEAAGMRCDFVGHPVVSEPAVSARKMTDFRKAYGLVDAPIILALPGSRRGEVARLAPIFGSALELVLRKHPNARVLVVAAGGVAHDVEQAVADWPGQPVLLDPRDVNVAQGAVRKRTAFAAADVALASSGTVSLELAAAATPTVIAYKLNWLTWQIMSRMAKVDTVTLTNLVTNTHVVPEFLGPDCQPERISQALIALLDEAPLRARQTEAMQQTMTALGAGGEAPGLRAARAVLDGLS